MTPGLMLFTRIPYSAHSAARVVVSWRTPALDTEYADWCKGKRTCREATEATRRIEPGVCWAIICLREFLGHFFFVFGRAKESLKRGWVLGSYLLCRRPGAEEAPCDIHLEHAVPHFEGHVYRSVALRDTSKTQKNVHTAKCSGSLCHCFINRIFFGHIDDFFHKFHGWKFIMEGLQSDLGAVESRSEVEDR